MAHRHGLKLHGRNCIIPAGAGPVRAGPSGMLPVMFSLPAFPSRQFTTLNVFLDDDPTASVLPLRLLVQLNGQLGIMGIPALQVFTEIRGLPIALGIAIDG